MKRPDDMVTATKHWDWKFAQHVWFDLNTVEKFDVEFAKCSAEFDPWLERWKNDARRAMDELDRMPKAKRKTVQRCYDMQLAIDQWFDHVYMPWFNGYGCNWGTGKLVMDPTFDDWLAAWSQRNTCRPENMLNGCGPVPDWRSPGLKAKEQARMAAKQQSCSEQFEKWQKLGKKK